MIKHYRKRRPVAIEAMRWDGDDLHNYRQITDWLLLHETDFRVDYKSLILPTLVGDMRAMPGDYIIKGINGEFYPCKPDIFEATYEEVAP